MGSGRERGSVVRRIDNIADMAICDLMREKPA